MSEELMGMLVIDKPAGLTSHDVVARVRRALGVKAGHTGTLDPQATGVLLVCLGRATRLVRFLQHADKVYDCTIRFGWETDTYDADGEPVAEPAEVPEFEPDRIRQVVGRFVGEIDQVPPDYSAKKIRGQPSYRRVRRGEEVEHDPVPVRIDAIDLLALEGDTLRLRVECGPGVYVRTLAVDIGRALDCPAHLAGLRRLRVGRFDLDDALDGARLEDGDRAGLAAAVLDPAQMLADWPAVVIDEDGRRMLANGGVVEPRCIRQRIAGAREDPVATASHGVWVRVLDDTDRMLAAAEARPGGVIQPRIVLRPTA